MSFFLRGLVLDGFRVFGGAEVSVPLDANVVLVHGGNASGKTSLLQAIELGLSGRVDELASLAGDYPGVLCHQWAERPCRVNLEFDVGAERRAHRVVIDEHGVRTDDGEPLRGRLRSGFLGRSLLTQRGLGGMIERLQGDDPKTKESKLVSFLRAAVGLDRLEAATTGLHDALDKRRVCNLSPSARAVDEELKNLDVRSRTLTEEIRAAQEKLEQARGLLADETTDLPPAGAPADAVLAWAGERLAALAEDLALPRVRRALDGATALGRVLAGARRWSAAVGSGDQGGVVPSLCGVREELVRVASALHALRGDEEDIAGKDEPETRQEGTTRLLEAALAELEGNTCPVCRRDYGELKAGTLRSALEAALAGQLGSMQAARDRAEEQAARVKRRAGLVEAHLGLGRVSEEAGAITASLLADVEALGLPAELVQGPVATLEGRLRELHEQVSAGGIEVLRRRIEAFKRAAEAAVHLERQVDELETKRRALRERETRMEAVLEDAKRVHTAAAGATRTILNRVFEDAGGVNQLWGWIFSRLARGELFVPRFSTDIVRRKLAIRTQLAADGVPTSYTHPHAVLSSANANTAALAIFLALHLADADSIPVVVLDDPVQSMDDVHVIELAALLRALVNERGRQLVLAVHERALYEYMKSELGPVGPHQSMCAVSLERCGRSTSLSCERLEWKPDGLFDSSSGRSA